MMSDADRIEQASARRRQMKAIKHALLSPIEWVAIGLGLAFFVILPHPAMLFLCDCVSRLVYLFDRPGRRLALENLRIVRGLRPVNDFTKPRWFDPQKAAYDPTPAERRIIRRSYRNLMRTAGHAFWTCRKGLARAAAVGEMSPRGKAFLSAHIPAVTVSGHIGCWELLSQLAILEGHRMLGVAKDVGTNGMTRLLLWARRTVGQDLVPVKGAFRKLWKGIRSGQSLGILVDQFVDPRDGGMWVRFLDRPMCVTAAPAFFASKVQLPIIVAWSRPLKNGHYRCEILDEITVEEAQDVWRTTQRCTRLLERIVRRHPSCWVLNYDYFRMYPNPSDLATFLAHEAAATEGT